VIRQTNQLQVKMSELKLQNENKRREKTRLERDLKNAQTDFNLVMEKSDK
jgi:hypothetical protein